jgi:hypothetical protein
MASRLQPSKFRSKEFFMVRLTFGTEPVIKAQGLTLVELIKRHGKVCQKFQGE